MLDYNHPLLQKLIAERGWSGLVPKDKITGIYSFVKDEIPFGYNASDDIPASQVLADGYGQCNTKSTLFMALLRAVGVQCRFHGFAIHKELQKGLINGIAYALAPKEIIHSWVEVNFNGKWYNLEGLILDDKYLTSLQTKFKDKTGSFCGYGVDVKNFNQLQVEWNECDTFIQKEGIVKDYGIFDSPDDFYNKVGANLSGPKRFLYLALVRNLMNRNVKKIRTSRLNILP